MLALLAALAGAFALFQLLQTLHISLFPFLSPYHHHHHHHHHHRRRLPGPFYAKFTSLPLRYHILIGNRMHHVHSLHQSYGPIVLISPNEVAIAISDPEEEEEEAAYARIHKIGNGGKGNKEIFIKSSWYDSMKGGPVAGLFAERDPQRHAARRKLLSRPFSNSSLVKNWEGEVKKTVGLAVGRIKRDALGGGGGGNSGGDGGDGGNGKKGEGKEGKQQQQQQQQQQQTADLLKWWTLMAQDVIAQLCFGESFHMVEQGKQTPYISAIQNALVYLTLVHQLPLLAPFIPYIPFSPYLRSLPSSIPIIFEGSTRGVKNMRDTGIHHHSLFSEMFALADSASNEKKEDADPTKISDMTISSEATNFIVAGSDSTAVTMTYIVHSVLSATTKNSNLQSELEAEVASLSSDLPSDELADASKAPLLNSVIRETLRLYGAIPSALPRVVPEGGVTFRGGRGKGEEGEAEYVLPGGTVVSTQAFSLHRDEKVWGPDAATFDGYRFVNETKTTKSAQKLAFGPFGAGSRVCIGIHLAMMELRLATAMFFRECPGARLAPDMTDDMMFQEERFFVAPRGHCCNIVLGEG